MSYLRPETPARRRSGTSGWVLVGGGWLLLVLAVAILLMQTSGSPLPAVPAALGTVCVVIGSFLLSAGRAIWMLVIGLFAILLWITGLLVAADEREVSARGEPITCEVMSVRREEHTKTVTDSRGRRTETDIDYWHTMRCPTGTYTVNANGPSPEGTTFEMFQVPGEKPRFAPGNSAVGLALASAGAVLTLAFPLLGWRRGRRRGIVPMPGQAFGGYPPPGQAQPGAPSGGQRPSPYEPW